MKPYIYSILFLFSVTISYAQTKELVLKKSFISDKNTILNIDVDNVTIQFKESYDDKIHLDYSIVFKENSDELIYKVFKDIHAKVTKEGNIVNVDIKNSMYLGELYGLDVSIDVFRDLVKDYFKKKKENKFLYKSKDSLLREINFSTGADIDDYFKMLKKQNPNKNLGKGSRKFKQVFIINVPKKLEIKIKALHSRITFNYNIDKPIKVDAFKTYFKFKNINNLNNAFNLTRGVLQAAKISGGHYNFTDVHKVVIGAIFNSKLNAETSKIQIGEVGNNVLIKDFNSKFYLYNFNETFANFYVNADYSELNLYNVKDHNFSMNVFGFNSTLNMDGTKTNFGNSKEKEMTKILEKKRKEAIPFLGNIKIELKNGLLNLK